MGMVFAAVGLAAGAVSAAVSSFRHERPEHAPGESERRRHREEQRAREAELQRIKARQEAERRRIKEEEERRAQREAQRREAQRLEAQREEQAALQEVARREAELRNLERSGHWVLESLEAERRKVEGARAEAQRQQERLQADIARDWPRPSFFRGHEHNVNVGFVGGSGVGKSSLINRILGSKQAAVDVKECTMEAQGYSVGRLTLWDLPGAGTDRFPRETYIKEMGLRHFDGLLIVTSTRFTQIDSELFREACTWEIPTYLVRTKADLDMESNLHDHGTPPRQTLQQLWQDLHSRLAHLNGGEPVSADHVFVVSARKTKFPNELGPEFERLMQNTQASIQKGRGGTR